MNRTFNPIGTAAQPESPAIKPAPLDLAQFDELPRKSEAPGRAPRLDHICIAEQRNILLAECRRQREQIAGLREEIARLREARATLIDLVVHLRHLNNESAFDLTDSPKSYMATVRRFCDEAEARAALAATQGGK
jgi:hypothetical protein